MNLTLRNIPEEIIKKIRILSKVEKRSINNEILLILEKGVDSETKQLNNSSRFIDKNTQVELWRGIAREWEDERTTDEIINDIYGSRTFGREVSL